ncbi:MAG TPA: hypothetical protein VFF43_23920 [Caldimonas sp.]|nr:hypothetical protein [Caldimonas sp.]
MTFDVEVVLKGRDVAVTENVSITHGDPASWDDNAVRDVLVGILRAVDRAQNPDAAEDRLVVLQGFSWIVEPANQSSIIAIEIPMGAAVAGPFAIGSAELDSMIARVLRAERQAVAPRTIH